MQENQTEQIIIHMSSEMESLTESLKEATKENPEVWISVRGDEDHLVSVISRLGPEFNVCSANVRIRKQTAGGLEDCAAEDDEQSVDFPF